MQIMSIMSKLDWVTYFTLEGVKNKQTNKQTKKENLRLETAFTNMY